MGQEKRSLYESYPLMAVVARSPHHPAHEPLLHVCTPHGAIEADRFAYVILGIAAPSDAARKAAANA